jgi:large subunit ribosomal protein L4
MDGSAPSGYSVKASVSTMLYHTEASRWFSHVEADVWFVSEAAAEAAGFTRWDRRGSSAQGFSVQG